MHIIGNNSRMSSPLVEGLIKVYPDIVVSASQSNLPLNGIRAWFIAKDYCRGRRGSIPVKAFRRHLKALGVARATYSRWIAEALELGLLVRIASKRKGLDYYKLAGWYTGAKIAGCKRLGTPASIELSGFTGRSWVSLTWAAYELRFTGKPVSRATLTALTDVPRRTQQYRETKAKVKQKENIAIYGKYAEIAHKDPDFIIGCYERPGMFVNKSTGDLCQQLPNSRVIPEGIERTNWGSTSKINKLLSARFRSDNEAKKQPFIKRYSECPKQTKEIKRSLKKRDDIAGLITIYERWKTLPGGVQGWAVCCV